MKTAITILFTVLCIAQTICFNSQAAEIPEEAIVKIYAKSEGKRKVGSGFIVKLDSQGAYIVTASHVVVGDKYPDVEFTSQKNVLVSATTVEIDGDDRHGLGMLLVDRQRLPSRLSVLHMASSKT